MTESLQSWDASGLRRILALAGPVDAALILHHLRADLTTASDNLTLALKNDDVEALRRSVHVLVALCGTAGATCLHHKACTLRDQIGRGLDAEARALALSLKDGAVSLARLLSTELEA